jgi:hypothetical protein
MTDLKDVSESREELNLDAETVRDLEVPQEESENVVGGSMGAICSDTCRAY